MFYLSGNKNLLGRSLFDEFFNVPFSVKSMKANVIENDQNYLFEIEIPGFKKEEIKITYEDNYLIVEANKVESSEDAKENKYLYKEIARGSVSRSFYVEEVDEDNIKANYDNGILNITLPKKIPVEVEKKYITIE